MASVIVIPAYQPQTQLLSLVEAIRSVTESPVAVINDGSNREYDQLFSKIAALENVSVLRHAVNLGKGAALKTAFNFVLNKWGNSIDGVVTADADGQHLPADINVIVRALEGNPAVLHLGTREFSSEVPLRSRFGNKLTRLVFKVLLGRHLKDTQTGLRGIPVSLLPELLRLSVNRYEFETEMLIQAVNCGFKIKETSISTIYEKDNPTSHFNPFLDSLKIYFVFLRFCSNSLLTLLIDYLVFAAILVLTDKIFASFLVARLVAGTFNYVSSRFLVFNSRGPLKREVVKYGLLVGAFMVISYGLVTTMVVLLGLNVFIAKFAVESTLFMASFFIQNRLIFRKAATEPEAESRVTDWDAYYASPFPTAVFSRKMTQRWLLRTIQEQFGMTGPENICELGGANSCFLAGIVSRFPKTKYCVMDKNRKGLYLLEQRAKNIKNEIQCFEVDVKKLPDSLPLSDLVFSTGLIEHFDPAGTATAIRTHFSLVKEGGVIIMTFPTSTWIYSLIRKTAELLGLWIFHDERPLKLEEVYQQVNGQGQIISSGINWGVILTQGYVVLKVPAQDGRA